MRHNSRSVEILRGHIFPNCVLQPLTIRLRNNIRLHLQKVPNGTQYTAQLPLTRAWKAAISPPRVVNL